MNNIIEKYRNWLSLSQSLNTVKNYIPRIEELLKQFKVEELNEDNIIQFLLKQKEQNKKPSTINGYSSAIKSFLIYIKKDIPLPQQPKVENKIPEHISEEYFEKEIIPVIETICKNPIKLKAILYFMFYTGVRIDEVANLERKNIDLTKRTAKIINRKNKEAHIVIFTKKVAQILKNYFSIFPEKNNTFNITTGTLQKWFDRMKPYFKDINLHAHLFRHSFSIHCLKKGVDVSVVSKLLGHRNIQSTMRYLKLNIDEIKNIYDKKIK